MNLQQLQYFRTLAEEKHYTKASKKLFITQPNLSYAISELEKELGVELFIRRGKSIELSSAGKVFLEYVDKALSALNEGIVKATNMDGKLHGLVRIAYIPSFGNTRLPILLKAFQSSAANADVEFNFIQGVNNEILELLILGKVDLAFCSNPSDEINSIPVCEQEIVVVVPESHPLAREEFITIGQIADEPLILVNGNSGLRCSINRIFKEASIQPKIAFEVDECSSVIAFVVNGLGVGIVSRGKVFTNKGYRAIPFDAHYRRSIYLAWSARRKMEPAVAAFRDFVACSPVGE